MTTTVEVLAAAFKEAGTPFIVGHPGGESVELMEAARQRNMRFLLMKQEVAGAMLAATWGDLTGSPGICLSTRGPGAANMVNGVAHAFLDRSPLIAITDTYSRPTYETGLRQRINQQAIYEPVVKWSTVIDAKTVRLQVRRAMRTATAAPPGPVHFEFPQSETTREAGDNVIDAPLLPNWITPAPDRNDLKPALDMLNRAKRPILIAGLGVYWCGASAEFVKFAERLGAPVLTTTKCKGMIPEDHPLRAGCIIGGLIERKLVMEADLIVTIGLDSVELQPKPWPYTLPVLSLSSIASTDALVPADPEIIGNLKSMLAGLAQWAPEGTNWVRNPPRTSAAKCATRSTRRQPACHRNAPWKSPAPSCRATPSPLATPAPADCWWCRSGNPTARANFSRRTGWPRWVTPCQARSPRAWRFPTGQSLPSPATAAS
jgi:acetolactate synthase-1/2/3 large subunit